MKDSHLVNNDILRSDSEIQIQVIDQKNNSRIKLSDLVRQQMAQKQLIKHTFHDSFHYLKKNATNLFNQSYFSDDQFKLQQLKPSPCRKLSIRRLKDLYPSKSPLFSLQLSSPQQPHKTYPHYPLFISQLHTLPFWHYYSLIQPKFVNQEGYYHVVIWKDGRLVKETIDDTFYYDQNFKQLYNHQLTHFQIYIWMHILIKAWAKAKGSYTKIMETQPFQFIKTFSYPDWLVVNPAMEDLQKLISHINPIQKKQLMAIAQTKNDINVGLYGFVPNSASYIIIGYEMQYQAIFIKLRSLTGLKWNRLRSSAESSMPQDQIQLGQNQFILPMQQFINLFHVIYLTSNKFSSQQDIFYNRYSLNLDARESKAKMVCIQVLSPNNESTTQHMVNVTIYFPFVRSYDLSQQRQYKESRPFAIPYCKLMCGLQSETTNLEASFVESMKEKMFQYDQTEFLCVKANTQYQWKQGTFFKGYDQFSTFLMRLKPGKYFLRFKIQTLKVQYRANINVVSSVAVKISDAKMDKKQQQQFLKQILSSKARLQKRNIGYFNPIKKGSWFICNDDFETIGYGYIVIQTRKNSDFKIQLKIDPKLLKQSGFRLKAKKDQHKYTIFLEDGQGITLILKLDSAWDLRNPRIWPPAGIEMKRLYKKQNDK